MQMILAVGAGGFIGAVGRYLLVARIGHWLGPNGVAGVPVGILSANVLGSLLMGVLAGTLAWAWSPAPELRAFLSVGVLGAFTTFSTFSLETVNLIQRGDWGGALVYILASVLISVLGLFAGLWSVRVCLS